MTLPGQIRRIVFDPVFYYKCHEVVVHNWGIIIQMYIVLLNNYYLNVSGVVFRITTGFCVYRKRNFRNHCEFQPALFEKYNRDHVFSSVLRLTCTILDVLSISYFKSRQYNIIECIFSVYLAFFFYGLQLP